MPHTCHATGCEREVPPDLFMCRPHWVRLPSTLRRRIWDTYRPGQEEDWEPSKDYLLAAKEAVIWLAQQEGKEPDTAVYDVFLRDLYAEP